MNINYHYYTVKTLARYAGLDDETAQFIASFSQQIDDFIMCSPFVVDKKPPDFFFQNGLARKLDKGRWVFSPCPTGVNMLSSISHNYQLHTLMPFHFIMPAVKNQLPPNADRSFYRCVTANQDESLLINRLMEKTVAEVNLKDKSSLMALGMLLHTFADTYAHSGFSGFHGWENESYVSKMEHKILRTESKCAFVRLIEKIKEKILGVQDEDDAMYPAEIAFYRSLPSIGHGNVAHAPDYCECRISLYAKKSEKGPLESYIERDNTEFFSDCSRRILDILCKINGKNPFSDEEWQELQEKLSEAQNVRNQGNSRENLKKWSSVFPEIKYKYNKGEFFNIRLEMLQKDKLMMDKLDVNKKDITNAYSEEGEKARAAMVMIAQNVNDLFYKYNELAYRHVFNAVGEYASESNAAQLADYYRLATEVVT